METTIPAVQHAIQNNIITTQQLVEMYLARIAANDGQDTATHLNSYLLVNPRAVKDAREANQGRATDSAPGVPIRSLADVVDFNIAFGPSATRYDQDLAVFSQMFDLSPDSADTDRDVRDRAEDIQRSRGAILALLNGPDGNPGRPMTMTRSSRRATTSPGRPRRPASRASSFRAACSRTS